METVKINSIIVDYIKDNLYPTNQERDFISKKYNDLKSILKGRTFQNGSFARNTSTTPVNDLDVFYVLSDEDYIKYKQLLLERKAFSVDDILVDIANFLTDEYGNKATIKIQSHSIGIYFGSEDEFSIDLVPAIPSENGLFWVPESSHLSVSKRRQLYENIRTKNLSSKITWIKSDPKGYINDASVIDEKTKNNFRKSAKFIKKWKFACKKLDNRFPIKSFHLELIVNKECKKNINLSCCTYIDNFFISIENYLTKPNFPDRANSSRYIDEYLKSLTEIEKDLVNQFIMDAKSIMKDIFNSDSEKNITELIDKLLGTKKNIIIQKEKIIPAFSKPYTY